MAKYYLHPVGSSFNIIKDKGDGEIIEVTDKPIICKNVTFEIDELLQAETIKDGKKRVCSWLVCDSYEIQEWYDHKVRCKYPIHAFYATRDDDWFMDYCANKEITKAKEGYCYNACSLVTIN